MPRLERAFERFRRSGDPHALAYVFDRAAPEVLRIAMHLARQPAEAEDLVQRTFLTAIEAAPRYDRSRRVVPWLLGILSNHVREAARAGRRAPDPARLVAREQQGPAAAAAQREAVEIAGGALDALPEPARAILVLRFRHGLEPTEIADALGLPPATVRSHLHRGVERLRRALPRGLSASAFAVVPTRGLAAVRDAVLARAGSSTTAAITAAATVVGLFALKRALVVAAAVLGLGGAATALVDPFGWRAPAERPASAQRPPTYAVTDATRPALATASPTAPALPSTPPMPFAAAPIGPTPDPGLPAERVTIDVRVVDDRGRPIPRAHARAMWGERAASPSVTDAEGRCRLEAAPRSRCIEVFSVDPDPTDPRQYCLITYAPLELEQQRARVVVPTCAPIRGRIEDERGQPVAGARIRVLRAGSSLPGGASDSEGSFVLAVAAGDPVDLLFSGAVGVREDPRRIIDNGRRGALRGVEPGASRVVLTASPAASDGALHVVVSGTEGRPVPGISVAAPWVLGAESKWALTGEDGVARIDALVRWPCQVVLFGDGEWATQDLHEVVPDGAEIRVTMRRVGARVRGRVVDPAGQPLAGVWIGAYDRHGIAAAFGTDSNGCFDSPANRDSGATLQLSARYPMDEPTLRGHAELRAGEREIEIQLRRSPVAFPPTTSVSTGIPSIRWR